MELKDIVEAVGHDCKGSLMDALDIVSAVAPGAWHNDTGPSDWWAVTTADHSIIAYFPTETQALNYRLYLINTALNVV